MEEEDKNTQQGQEHDESTAGAFQNVLAPLAASPDQDESGSAVIEEEAVTLLDATNKEQKAGEAEAVYEVTADEACVAEACGDYSGARAPIMTDRNTVNSEKGNKRPASPSGRASAKAKNPKGVASLKNRYV